MAFYDWDEEYEPVARRPAVQAKKAIMRISNKEAELYFKQKIQAEHKQREKGGAQHDESYDVNSDSKAAPGYNDNDAKQVQEAGLRPATAADYADFLIKYLEERPINKIKVSSIPFAEVQELIKVVTSDGSISLGKGDHLDVIIPEGFSARFSEESRKGGTGVLYNMSDCDAISLEISGKYERRPLMWIYDEVAREMVNKGWEFEKEHFETSRNKLLLPRNNLSRVQKWINDPNPLQAALPEVTGEYTQPEVHAVEYSGDMAAYYGRETIFGRELLAQGQVDKDKNPHGLWEYFKEPADRQFAFFNNGEGIASAPSMDALTALPEVQAALGLMPNPTAEYFNNAMKQVAQRRPPSAAAALEQVAQIRPEQALLPAQPKPAEDMVQTQETALKVEI